MSEYQYVYFAVVDRALDDEQLEFMRRQSTRAEISRWEFSNEYHFGDFHGKADEMLRRGYDVHLHYANFGIRRLMFRLPSGLPWSPEVFGAYQFEYAIDFKRDNEGNAGVLCFEPEADAGTYDEDFFEFDHLTAALPGLRQMLIRGDLRPLYLAWLACVGDEDAREPPVPAGLSQRTRELDALCEFYELSPDLVAAAAESSPAAPPAQDEQRWLQEWIDDRPVEQLRELVRRMLRDGEQTLRAETLARIRQATASGAWPTCEAARTVAELRAAANDQQSRRKQRATAAREKARKERLAAIAADPNQTIDHVRLLVKMRSTSDYEQAARELAELREALGPTHGESRAREVAAQLVRDNPTLNRLKSALRGQGLLPKS